MTRQRKPAQRGRRGRIAFAGVGATTFSALFIAPPALLPGAEVTPLLVFAGVALPFGVAALALALAEDRIERDLVPDPAWRARQTQATREEVSAR